MSVAMRASRAAGRMSLARSVCSDAATRIAAYRYGQGTETSRFRGTPFAGAHWPASSLLPPRVCVSSTITWPMFCLMSPQAPAVTWGSASVILSMCDMQKMSLCQETSSLESAKLRYLGIEVTGRLADLAVSPAWFATGFPLLPGVPQTDSCAGMPGGDSDVLTERFAVFLESSHEQVVVAGACDADELLSGAGTNIQESF